MTEYVPGKLERLADLYRERNASYGDNYKRIGLTLHSFLGTTVLDSPADYARFANFLQLVGKVVRYGVQFQGGGHDDSLDDNAVYAMMQHELDHLPDDFWQEFLTKDGLLDDPYDDIPF